MVMMVIMPDSHIISVELLEKKRKFRFRILELYTCCQLLDSVQNSSLYFNRSLVLEEVGKIFLYKFTELGVS
jgi:hypothetical protein